jgi:exonuclease III
MSNRSEKSLESWIWDAACSIRGAQEAPKFKDFILPLIFTKRLCDVFDDELNRIAQEVGSRVKAFKLVEKDHKLVRFYLPLKPENPDDAVWSVIRKLTGKIGESLTTYLHGIAKANPGLEGIIDRMDFNATTHGQRDIDERVRVVSWNIQQGASKRGSQVVDALLGHAPDVVVLTEYHAGRSELVANRLGSAGLVHQATASAGFGYEVFIGSKWALTIPKPLGAPAPQVGGYLEAGIQSRNLIIAGVYVPVIRAVPLGEKLRFWSMLHAAALRNLDLPYLVTGDWNTGDLPLDKETPGGPFGCWREYRRMKELGFDEAWRTLNGERREYTWRSNQGTGFRIDHAFVSPGLGRRLVAAQYSHKEREAKISDHSLMVVDLAAAA